MLRFGYLKTAALDDAEISRLVAGFRASTIYPIIAVSAFTGARLREVIALSWDNVDLENRAVAITRALEETKGHRGTKAPKTERGTRVFKIDDNLADMLVAHRERQQRLIAGVPDGAEADVSLIVLPEGALLFPGGDGTDLTRLRDARAVSRAFKRRVIELGFPPTLLMHDLRGSHETALLDAGVPVHVVAERAGHDPAVLLRKYAKRTKKADAAAADVIAGMSAGALSPKTI
jgi:integrase